MLKGKKIILRPLQKSDVPFLTRWMNDLEVTQFLMRYLPATEIEEEEWVNNLCTKHRDGNVVFVIEAIKARKAIGVIGLHDISWKDRNAVFGIAIGEKKFWSKGYGTEACQLMLVYGFDHLNLHRISSGAFGFNERSQKMHLNTGFKKEGQKRQAIFKNGHYFDTVEFGLLAEEWRKTKK